MILSKRLIMYDMMLWESMILSVSYDMTILYMIYDMKCDIFWYDMKGTENVALAVGLGTASHLALQESYILLLHMLTLKKRLIELLLQRINDVRRIILNVDEPFDYHHYYHSHHHHHHPYHHYHRYHLAYKIIIIIIIIINYNINRNQKSDSTDRFDPMILKNYHRILTCWK